MLLNNIKLHISIFLVADIIIAVVDVVDLESNTGDVFFPFCLNLVKDFLINLNQE